jgi:hypothetical protein
MQAASFPRAPGGWMTKPLRAGRIPIKRQSTRPYAWWNNDVIDNLDGVLETLQSELEKSPLTPPSPRKRGEGDGDSWQEIRT